MVNVEFKARCSDRRRVEEILVSKHAKFIGEDHQMDTYFHVTHGRLKLREGNIEHALIHYNRKNIAGAKQSDIILYQHAPDPSLKEMLTQALGIKAIVRKRRKIYFIDNVKFHLDEVDGLGEFIEVEAIDKTGELGIEKLEQQCNTYLSLLQVQHADLVDCSYSDLLLDEGL
jgi:adenylate cyclase class 2